MPSPEYGFGENGEQKAEEMLLTRAFEKLAGFLQVSEKEHAADEKDIIIICRPVCDCGGVESAT